MATKHLLFIASCLLLGLTQVNGLEVVNGKIKITIGTTAGCSDTVRFVGDHLIETVDLYGKFMEVEFVPWGRSVWHDNGTITCQFYERDCWANRLHRCALNMLKGDQDAQMHYMTCEFTNPRPSFLLTSYQCAQAVGLNLIEVDHCVNNFGDDLDRAAQIAAIVPMASINFVPYVVFNDVIDVNLHIQGITRLKSLICFALAADPSTGVSGCQI